MWAYPLICPSCKANHLSAAGHYKTVRRVLDRDGWYFMATQNLYCNITEDGKKGCGKKLAAWAQSILDQLDHSHREQFPAVLTYR